IFVLFNMVQRRRVLLNTYHKVKNSSFRDFARKFSAVPAEAIKDYTNKKSEHHAYEPSTEGEHLIERLLREIHIVQGSVPGSPSMKNRMRNEIRSLIIAKGNPSFFITINPADVYSPILRLVAGDTFDIDNMLSHDIIGYFSQAQRIAENPVMASKFFDLFMEAFF
ncbi:hypothetical protein BJ165DRAFT_1315472, partial [Panaeolus papilionaceus]